ncbi:unnamed protein product [Caenorhabditis brenneri]
MPSLLDMTDVPMTNILEQCTYKSVLALRKVCHSLRNFVDDSCFKTDLDKIFITIGPTGFSLRCYPLNVFLPNGNGFAKDWTSNDLTILLKLIQNSKLSCLTVITIPQNVGGSDDLEEDLKNQTRPLHTERFEMEGSDVVKVLPYLDSKTLKKISITPAGFGNDVRILDRIEKVIELEQFKNAVEIDISSRFFVRVDLRKFLHFQKVFVMLHETSLEEFVALKEAFVASTHMEEFFLNGRGLDENQLKHVFGTPFHDRHGDSQWYFKIGSCKEHVLRIKFTLDSIFFRKWEAEEVPQNAVVRH